MSDDESKKKGIKRKVIQMKSVFVFTSVLFLQVKEEPSDKESTTSFHTCTFYVRADDTHRDPISEAECFHILLKYGYSLVPGTPSSIMIFRHNDQNSQQFREMQDALCSKNLLDFAGGLFH